MVWLMALSWGSKLLPFLKIRKLWYGLAILAAVLGAYFYVTGLQGKIVELRDEKRMYMEWYQIAADANATNIEAVGLLKGANEALAKSVMASEEETIAAIEEAAARELRARLQLDETLDELEELRNESPECEAISKIDLGIACPLSVERLRQHAAGTLSNN